MFRQRYACLKTVSMTDTFEIAEGKTSTKIEPGEVLEQLGSPVADQGGMLRMECSVASTGKMGFITLKGNQGTLYLEKLHPFNDFFAQLVPSRPRQR